MTKRPLCIDSRVVERIDRLTADNSESVFRCALNKATSFSAYFNSQLNEFSYRIQRIERILEEMDAFEHKVQITIVDDRAYLFHIQDHHIFIGKMLMESPGHLEKALAKIWFRERNSTAFQHFDLLEEIVTDFIVHLDSGKLELADPDTKIKTVTRKLKWPYIVKTVEAYCESPWKRSEHYSSCQNGDFKNFNLVSEAFEMGLRPLLTTNFIGAFNKLTLKERFRFLQEFPKLIRSYHVSQLSSPEVEQNEDILNKLTEAIENINSYISQARSLNGSPELNSFVTNFSSELKSSGFN